MFDRQMLVGVVIGPRFVGAPTIGPDFGRAQQLAASAQDDSEGLIIEN